MLYAIVRAVVGFALRLFYRVQVQGTAPSEGPLILLGNHPNGLIDPALVFIITDRQVTFLAKAPLFKTPVIGWLVRGMKALPVYRRQDDPSQMDRNEGTFKAATQALVQGGAINLFPEGKSHSEPGLAELKTGAARIALRAVKEGAALKLLPVGLTYEDKTRFRSEVLIQVGQPIDATAFLPRSDEDEPEQVRRLTDAIALGLKAVTLNLDAWEDLPVVTTAEALYAFRLGDGAKDAERLRLFARGMDVFRREQQERFERLRQDLLSFHRRLSLVHASTEDLKLVYRVGPVVRFTVRNLFALGLGLPLFVLGMALFAPPFALTRLLPKWLAVSDDLVATAKLLGVLLIGPLWLALLTAVGWRTGGPAAGVGVLIGSMPLAAFTRYFYERRRVALRDVALFFVLGRRGTLKARLLGEAERLAAEVDRVVQELKPKVAPAA